jgi:outer membrane biogenesis lipoprotein LolB
MKYVYILVNGNENAEEYILGTFARLDLAVNAGIEIAENEIGRPSTWTSHRAGWQVEYEEKGAGRDHRRPIGAKIHNRLNDEVIVSVQQWIVTP